MQIIVPKDVEPTVNPNSPAHVSGQQVHRRILSPIIGGPKSIDIGYNSTKAGLDYNTTYAYDRDEFCYNAEGIARVESDGEIVKARTGMFMWRPSGAATQRIFIEENYRSICAFGPARVDGWSHILPDEMIGKWPQGETRPRLSFVDFAAVEPTLIEGVGEPVQFRRIFDTPHMEVSHIILPAGAKFSEQLVERDEVYWVEKGQLEIDRISESRSLTGHDFLYLSKGEQVEGLVALADSVVLRWAAI